MDRDSVALDIGGGPGDHAARWAKEGVRGVVVDPSPDMNRLAAMAGIAVVRARAETLPFRDHSVRLAYFHLSVHHARWRRALDEARRVLVTGGRVAVLTLGPQHHATSMLARWFPRVAELDRRRFPDPAAICEHFGSLGASVRHVQEIQVKRRRAGDWVDAVRARFVSTLQLLGDEEIETGLGRMIAATGDLDAVIEYPMVWEEITAVF